MSALKFCWAVVKLKQGEEVLCESVNRDLAHDLLARHGPTTYKLGSETCNIKGLFVEMLGLCGQADKRMAIFARDQDGKEEKK